MDRANLSTIAAGFPAQAKGKGGPLPLQARGRAKAKTRAKTKAKRRATKVLLNLPTSGERAKPTTLPMTLVPHMHHGRTLGVQAGLSNKGRENKVQPVTLPASLGRVTAVLTMPSY